MDYQEQINEFKAKAQAEIDKIMSKLRNDVEALEASYKAKTHYTLEDYSNGVGYQAYFVDLHNKVDFSSVVTSEDAFMRGYADCISINSVYPTADVAHEAARMKQLNDDLLYFKYTYDREYSPDDYWSDIEIPKWSVYCNMPDAKYEVTKAFYCGYNTVYFSSEAIAKKCADFLNRKYKLGEYADGEA